MRSAIITDQALRDASDLRLNALPGCAVFEAHNEVAAITAPGDTGDDDGSGVPGSRLCSAHSAEVVRSRETSSAAIDGGRDRVGVRQAMRVMARMDRLLTPAQRWSPQAIVPGKIRR